MNYQRPFLSVVIPALNEERNIATTLSEVEMYLTSKKIPFEMIVVNDGSTDRTRQIIIDWNKLGHRVILLENVQRRGKGYAVRQGIFSSQGAWVLFMDADNATSIKELEKCWPWMNGEWDLLIGSRRIAGAIFAKKQSRLREICGTLFVRLVNLLLCPGIRDFNCGFKCFRREVALELFRQQTREDWTFDVEILLLAKKRKYRINQFPVTWAAASKTNVKILRDSWCSLLGLFHIGCNLVTGKYRSKT